MSLSPEDFGRLGDPLPPNKLDALVGIDEDGNPTPQGIQAAIENWNDISDGTRWEGALG